MYRNKSAQLASYLADHNVRLSASRTINQMPAEHQTRVLNKAFVAPPNDHKLHKLRYSNPVKPATGLVDSGMTASVKADGINETSQEQESSDPLMTVNMDSHFTMTQSLVEQEHNGASVDPNEPIFVRHHNCVYFVANDQMTVGSMDSLKNLSSQPEMPMINASSVSSCSAGLTNHSRRFQILFDWGQSLPTLWNMAMCYL